MPFLTQATGTRPLHSKPPSRFSQGCPPKLTFASYYINPPGTGDEGCIWGDESKPVGNWAPYVAGANTDGNGQTFLKLGFNPIYEFEGPGLDKNALSFGVRIDCPDGGCNGLPCELNPSEKKYGEVISNQGSVGAGGSSFCVVTVPSGKKANVVVFNLDGSEGDYDEEVDEEEEDDYPEDEPTTTSVAISSTSETASSSSTSGSSSKSGTPTVGPGLFKEGGSDSTESGSSATESSKTEEDEEEEEDEPNRAAGRQSGAALAGLVVALAAASYLY